MISFLLRRLPPLVLLLAVAPCVAGEEAPDDPPPLATVAWLDAPVQDVWAVLTTGEGWRKLGVAKATVDLRVGGKILSHYDPEGTLGDDKTIENTILTYEPQRMISIRATKAPAGFPFPREVMERTWSVFTLHDLGDGRTRLVVRGHGYGTDEASRKMRQFFERGNAWTLQRLAQALGGSAPKRPQPVELSVVVRAVQDDVFTALSADGDLLPSGCTPAEGVPGRVRSFRWTAPATFEGTAGRTTSVVIELEREAPGYTRVWLTHAGFSAAAGADPEHARAWSLTRAHALGMWSATLKKLALRFTAR